MLYTERIKALRSDHDLNQTQVARAIHVAQTTYSDYEKGKVRIPVECLIQLAKFYDVDMNYITGVSDTLRPFPKPPVSLYINILKVLSLVTRNSSSKNLCDSSS